MTHVVSFGTYEFDNRLTQLDVNFANTVPRTMRLPGLEGGFDEYGDSPAPSEIGKVTARFRFNATSGTAMQALRDAVRGLAALGRGTLVIQPSGGTAAYAERWTWARINSVQVPEKMAAISDAVQDISVDWQVAESRWYSDNAASGTAAACSGTATNFSRTNGGNAVALPVITVIAGGTALNTLVIKRLDGATVRDRISYSGTVAIGGTLVIDCRALSVYKNGAEAYSAQFEADHPAWMRMQPGSNDFRVELESGKGANVQMDWDDTWY